MAKQLTINTTTKKLTLNFLRICYKDSLQLYDLNYGNSKKNKINENILPW